MTDTFRVVHDTFGSEQAVPLTQADFEKIRLCLRRLGLVLQVEEALDIAVSNYGEFEREVAGIIIARELRRDSSAARWNLTRRAMSRVLSNLLSSIRTFQHLAESALSELYGDAVLKAHQDFKSQLYDGSFGYRVMERLRNHAQHQGLAVNSQTFSGRWLFDPEEQTRRRIQSFTPELDLTQMALLPKWRALAAQYATMREADPELPERLNLLRLVRVYMSDLSKTMVWLRDRFDADLDVWSEAITAYRDLIPERDEAASLSGTLAIRFRDYEVLEELSISNTVLEDIRQLQDENRPLTRHDLFEMRI